MSKLSEEELHNEKDVAYYSALVTAWVESRMELGKSLIRTILSLNQTSLPNGINLHNKTRMIQILKIFKPLMIIVYREHIGIAPIL
jgi:hypothetical protein